MIAETRKSTSDVLNWIVDLVNFLPSKNLNKLQ